MYTIDELRSMPENQIYDRKSIRIDLKALAIQIVAFANADGGTIAIGISDDGQIEGVNAYEQKINDILRVPFDYCSPTVKAAYEYLDCIDSEGNENRILLINVNQSTNVHANQADEVFYRVGDKSKRLTFDERTQLLYDKGDMLYENIYLKNATANEIDLDMVAQYAKLLGSSKKPLEFLHESINLIDTVTGRSRIKAASILLFGKNPQAHFPCARIRFLKYEGVEEKTGAQMNIIKDIMFEGPILQMLQNAIDFVQTQIKEYTKLHKDAKFHTVPEYPEFVWKEAIINAVVHRDYHILGTDIQIKMFDDRFVVESPGTLPGLVRLNNMRNMHFSRNPMIARYLRDYKFVRELGEGVDRMYRELLQAGFPAPEYKIVGFMTVLTVKKFIRSEKEKNEPLNELLNEPLNETLKIELSEIERVVLSKIDARNVITKKELSKQIEWSEASVKRAIDSLKEKGILERKGSKKAGYWHINKELL